MDENRKTVERISDKNLCQRSFHHTGFQQKRRRVLAAFMLAILLCVIFLSLPSATHAQEGKSARVADSILGIKIGTSLEDARAKLKGRGTTGGRDTRDGGRKEAWTLKKTEYSSIAYQTDGHGRVKWVTGFVRPGKEIRFSKLGDLARASRKSEQVAIWNVETPEGNFRLRAEGSEGKARVIQLLSLAVPSMQ